MTRISWRRLRSGSAALLLACAPALTACAGVVPSAPPVSPAADTVRVTTFGDSNTDMAWSAVEPHVRARSYVSDLPPRPQPGVANDPDQLAGLVEARWHAQRTSPVRVVNHGISGTTSGGGGHGGADRNRNGAPNARAAVGGVTRFEGEVLGRGLPWSGGEPAGDAYPSGPILRVNAYVPGANDFAYVSIGTNDLADAGMTAAETLENLGWMVEQWVAAGHAADHIVLTTLPPRQDRDLGDAIPTINAGVRALASRTGAGLIDLAAHTSPDDGRTWRDTSMHIGDRLHYTTPVRDWIAGQLVSYIAARVAAALP
jgi:lysophospholipase L1-like esterase